MQFLYFCKYCYKKFLIRNSLIIRLIIIYVQKIKILSRVTCKDKSKEGESFYDAETMPVGARDTERKLSHWSSPTFLF